MSGLQQLLCNAFHLGGVHLLFVGFHDVADEAADLLEVVDAERTSMPLPDATPLRRGPWGATARRTRSRSAAAPPAPRRARRACRTPPAPSAAACGRRRSRPARGRRPPGLRSPWRCAAPAAAS